MIFPPAPRIPTFLLFASLAALSCDVELGALAAPEPDPPAEPRGPRQGRVVVDRTDRPARVTPGDPEAPRPEPADALLAWLNAARADAQLLPLRFDDALTASASAHAGFLVAHRAVYEAEGLSAHVQPPGLDGFTGASFVDRAAHFAYPGKALAEVIAFKASSVAAGRSWMESLYHRVPLLSARVEEVGYGDAQDGAYSANVLELGRASEAPALERLVLWPLPGAVDVPMAWDGAEVPQPAPPPAGYPSGPVLTVQATASPLVAVDAVVEDPHGEALPATVLSAANDPHLTDNVIMVIPHRPLAPRATYTVRVSGTADGEPFTETWTFTTRGEGCDLVAQDCGPGQGCYLVGGEPHCLWAGVLRAGGSCEHLNSCEAGLTCLGSRCQPFCDASTGAPADRSCGARCPHGTLPLEPGLATEVCLAASCALDAASCGEGEGCYWVGAFLCDDAGTAPAGAACQYANDCAPGHGCLGWGGEFRCRALCGGDGMPTCAARCANDSMPLDPATGVRFCP